MQNFDFSAPAELFPSRNRKVASKVKYRRFESAADAIRFAMEELPEPQLLGACIEINDRPLGHQEIRALYDSAEYPLKKKQVPSALDHDASRFRESACATGGAPSTLMFRIRIGVHWTRAE